VKAFINRSFLDAHIAKRHASFTNSDPKPQTAAALPPAAVAPPPAGDSEQSVEMDAIKARLKQTELKLGKEIEARNEVERKVSTQ
jgi:hypothetical protein